MHIRTARLTDAEAIRGIYNRAIGTIATFDLEPRSLEEQQQWLAMRSGAHVVLVADENGIVAGFASLSPYRDRPAYRTTVENSVYVDHNLGTVVKDGMGFPTDPVTAVELHVHEAARERAHAGAAVALDEIQAGAQVLSQRLNDSTSQLLSPPGAFNSPGIGVKIRWINLASSTRASRSSTTSPSPPRTSRCTPCPKTSPATATSTARAGRPSAPSASSGYDY